eukprot:435346_1
MPQYGGVGGFIFHSSYFWRSFTFKSGLCITCLLLCRSAWSQDSLPNIYHLQTVLYFQNFLTIVIPVTSIAMVKLGEHLLYHIYFGTYEEFIYCLQSIVLLLEFMKYF